MPYRETIDMTSKQDLRTRAAQARRARTEPQREAARAAIRVAVTGWCGSHLDPAGTSIAAYEPLATEPGSIELLVELHRAGYQVLVPITLPDRDLDWAVWRLTRQARLPLGPDAIATAALVLLPAFAVDRAGRRLGRGGGSYDRALARVPAGTPTAALLFDDELVDEVPVDDWDRPVSAVVTPSGWLDLTG